jgi:UPF0716 protein FxsA
MPVLSLLLLWPLIEIAGFAWIGGMIGAGPTVAFVLASGLLGLSLLREAGPATLLRLRDRIEAGETPLPAALDGAWRILAGLLLALPGFFSSAAGLLLLLPPIRHLLTAKVARRLEQGGDIRIVRFGGGFGPGAARGPRESTVIEGEYKELPPDRPELSPRR